jgi:Ca2+-binding RTX toxin-like protein
MPRFTENNGSADDGISDLTNYKQGSEILEKAVTRFNYLYDLIGWGMPKVGSALGANAGNQRPSAWMVAWVMDGEAASSSGDRRQKAGDNFNPGHKADPGEIAAIQFFATKDGEPIGNNDYLNPKYLVASISNLAIDKQEFITAASDNDNEIRYHFMVSLLNGNLISTGSSGDDDGIEVGEGGKATIRSKDGDDTVWVWHKKNVDFDGGDGTDTLRFEHQIGSAEQPVNGAMIDLAAGTGTNAFGGKITLRNVENVVGQFGGSNDLRGDGHANYLRGGTQADTLMGRGGDDEIYVKYHTNMDPRQTLADGGSGQDVLFAELSYSDAAPFTGSGSTLRIRNTLDLENPENNTGTFHGGTFKNLETFWASGDQAYLVFDFHGSAKGEKAYGTGSEDTLEGRGGNDQLAGNFGGDLLTGGGGADRFWFRYATDSNAAGQDTITDFSHAQHDRIDLTKIYAPKLDFIGSEKFHGHAGELHAVKKGGDTLVEADTNGDKTADFALLLDGGPKVIAGDFIL